MSWRAVNEAVAPLHFAVFEPNGRRRVVDVQDALVDAARTLELLLGFLPLRVLEPDADALRDKGNVWSGARRGEE